MKQLFLTTLLGLVSLLPTVSAAPNAGTHHITIVSPRDASFMEQLAAREVRRYVYLRTGQLVPIMRESKRALPRGDVILVARQDRPLIRSAVAAQMLASLDKLAAQSYWLRTVPHQRPLPRASRSC